MINNNQIDDDKTIIKYCYPFCKEKGCFGVLKYQINEKKLSIDYECQNNKDHYGNNLYFSTFERYYLKEDNIKAFKCSNCLKIITTTNIYKCKQCKKIFCQYCYSNDEHIKTNNNNVISIENKNKNNFILNLNKKCPKCNKNIHYCLDCLKKMCIYCSDYHKKHKTIIYNQLYHNYESINYILSLIEEKSKINEQIINSLDNWVDMLNRKINNIKERLRDQIRLLKKMALNFNPFFEDPIYSFNFWNLFHHLKYLNNKDINKFKGDYGFEEQTRYIFDLLVQKDFQTEKKIGLVYFNFEENLNNSILHKIDNNYYLVYTPYNKRYRNLKLKTIDNEYGIDFKDNICSISSSIDKKEIYVCLSNEKKVKIINIYLDLLIMELSENEIIGSSLNYNDHFNKCIQISDNNFATIDTQDICIWAKTRTIGNKSKIEFLNISKIELKTNITELLIDNNYFISCQPINHIVSFINIFNFKEETIIKNKKFEFNNQKNSLILVKKFIVVNCLTGIGFISTKTKEFVQFIDNKFEKKFICLYNQDIFYVLSLFQNLNSDNVVNDNLKEGKLYLWGSIEKYKLLDGSYSCIEKYKEIYSNNKSAYINPSTIINVNNNFIIFPNQKFSLIEKVVSEVTPLPDFKEGYKILFDRNKSNDN